MCATAQPTATSSPSDTVSGIKTPGDVVKERRIAHGLTQRRLAHRAGTSQSAIARIESGREEVTWSRLRQLLLAVGEEPVLASAPLPSRHDAAFNEVGGELAAAGRARKST